MYQDKSDIQEYVRNKALEIDADSAPPDLLKKRPGKANYMDLALSGDCIIDEPAHLISLHEWIQTYWADPKRSPPIDTKMLRKGEEYVTDAYGRGFVGQDLEEDLQRPPTDRAWVWAVEPYQKHRTHQLDFLRFSAEREIAESKKVSNPAEREKCIRRARDFYIAIVLTGSRIYPDVKRCKAALHHVRILSEQLNDRATAVKIEQTYETNINNWEQLRKRFQSESSEEE